MRRFLIIAVVVLITLNHTICHADCDCNDWMDKEGYCVDYVKERIPIFPVPNNVAEIAALKNKRITEVLEGDVAIFDLGNYWHVSYVEKVHLDQSGNPVAIDVSEMNFGDQMSFYEYKNRWGQKNRSEWKRALCCGVTDEYGRKNLRNNVALNSVTQIWSPYNVEPEGTGGRRIKIIADKVREVLNRFNVLRRIEL